MTTKNAARVSLFLMALFFMAASAHGDDDEKIGGMERSARLFQRGEFAEAGAIFQAMLSQPHGKGEAPMRLEAAMKLAESCKALGRHQRALRVFEQALPFLKRSGDRYRNAVFLNGLADLYFTLGNMEAMSTWLLRGLEEARKAGRPSLLAATLNDLGNARAWGKDYKQALAAYEESLEIMADDQSRFGVDLKFKTRLNQIRALGLNNETQKASDLLDRIFLEFTTGADRHGHIVNLLGWRSLVEESRGWVNESNDASKRLFMLDQILNRALKIAKKMSNAKHLSYIYGYLGQLREEGGRYEEAKKLTLSAIFFAGQINAPEILYLWQWQMGRLFAAQKNSEQAIFFYEKSIGSLNPIRGELFSGYRSRKDFFNLRVKPVYLGLARLLLDQGKTASDETVSKDKMVAARQTMEILKTAELQNFFQSECAVTTQKYHERADRTPDGAVLLYPIVLKDRLVLLATFPDGIKQKQIHVTAKELKQVVINFRVGLQNRTDRRFIYDAKKLYQWLIRPFEAEFEYYHIDTLIIAPDGALRLIPFSTLHDGEKFVIENYAVGVIPAISLTNFDTFKWPETPKILISGLSEATQGFPPLPSVAQELKDIRLIMNAKTLYSGKEHSLKNLKNEFENNDYSIVHLATHGVFGDSPENTFLLLYEGRLTMNDLSELIQTRRFNKKPVELLTLSACQTALGDERAALGLAGAAVKAGVKSVMATLWFVDDEATSFVIREFYRQLKISGMSKAKALQNAQKSLISKKRYRHPAYWAPFLLIGNWM